MKSLAAALVTFAKRCIKKGITFREKVFGQNKNLNFTFC